MGTPKLWSNVQVDMQSALGSNLTISAITKDDPGVATSTAHGLLDGAYVLLTINGMHQLNGKIARVANKTADTIELEDIDTTLFGTFTSGTMNEITFGTSIGSIRNLTASGGDFGFEDTTTIHDETAKQLPGIASAAVYTAENIWDVSDVGLVAMKVASDTKTTRGLKFTFADGQIMVFSSYVGASLLPTGTAQGLITSPTVFTAFGTPTYYAS